MPVRDARKAAEVALEYVDEVLQRDDLEIEQVEADDGEWIVTFGGISNDYELRIDAGTGSVLGFKRV